MSKLAEAFPLSWPVGRPRAKYRERARFGSKGPGYGVQQLSIYASLERLRGELGRLSAGGVVVSTNIPVRLDGLPYSKTRAPNDPGAAVYFRLKGQAHCLACDKWDRVADNIAAIAAHIGAIRGQARWGVGDLAQAFAGYRALPAVSIKKPWHEILGVPEQSSTDEIRTKFRELAQRHHPDHGGNGNQMAEITAAYNEAMGVG